MIIMLIVKVIIIVIPIVVKVIVITINSHTMATAALAWRIDLYVCLY